MRRRRFGAVAATVVLAGCAGDEGGDLTARSEGGVIESAEVVYELKLIGPPDESLLLRVARSDELVDATEVVLVSPDGEQVGGATLATGESAAEFDISDEPGVYEALVVRGGETDCTFVKCEHTGGEVLGGSEVVVE